MHIFDIIHGTAILKSRCKNKQKIRFINFLINLLTRYTMGIPGPWPPMVGRFAPNPLLIFKQLDRFLILKGHLVTSGLNLINMLQNFISTSLMTSSDQRPDFYYLSLLVSPGKATVSNWNKADGTTWIASGKILRTLLSLLRPCAKTRSPKVTRSRR